MLKSRDCTAIPLLVVTFGLFLGSSPSFHASAITQTAATPGAEERNRGLALYKQGNFADAAKVFRKAVEKNKPDHEGWYYLGLALLQQSKELKNATKAFETATRLSPNFAAAHAGLSYAFLLRNKSSDAIREANLALSIDPNIVDAHYVIGVAHLRAGAKELALQEAETVIKLNPQGAAAYLLKSQALTSFFGDAMVLTKAESPEVRQARYREAGDALEKYLQLAPNAKQRQTWIEQLESLRFHTASYRKSAGIDIFSGREVTTKARVLRKPEPQYTEAARKNGITGTVVLRAVFASDATVKHFLVVNGLPDGLTQQAIRAARLIKFTPAMIDGRPVSMFIQLEYNFNLY
jgi:tetratricopeptide (TPR) repeat protein